MMTFLKYFGLPLFIILSLMCISSDLPLKKKKILFFGDSITEMGVNNGGYIDKINDAISKAKKSNEYELTGAGIGGNKVYDLYLRMESDVLDKKPDIVLIYVGINDVWHKTSGIGTDIEKYEQFYRAILKKLIDKGITPIVCTPTVIGEKPNNANPQDEDLNAYSNVIRKLSKEYGIGLVDLRKAFADYELKNNTKNLHQGLLTTDGVHLSDAGNQLVADEMLKILKII
jgi:lysophospholipase L1-like esterase